ncbi:MAG: outer membrane lipid asymmetry maintenance protein MlaD [Rhodobacter sp.]|nr:outer membrane lipid asymmetry maintenance protein MlaD [Rhodobacter sp.]
MTNHTTEVLVGGAVLAVAIGFFVYAGQLTGVAGPVSGASAYSASFRSVEGVTVGTDVRLGGVKVGTVTSVVLDPKTFRAETGFTVDGGISLPEDTAAVIASEGLLGGSFVELIPGGSPFDLEPGSEILDTQSAISIINLLLKFVAGDEEVPVE